MDKKLMILMIAQLVLVLAAVGGTWFLTSSQIAELKMSAANGEESAEAPALKEPVYFSMDPAFVVNFQDGRTVRYLQIELDVMARSEDVIGLVEKYNPRIRNDLIMLFSGVQRENVTSPEGRAQLQVDAQLAINTVLQQEAGSPGVEAVYFTKFVMQ